MAKRPLEPFEGPPPKRRSDAARGPPSSASLSSSSSAAAAAAAESAPPHAPAEAAVLLCGNTHECDGGAFGCILPVLQVPPAPPAPPPAPPAFQTAAHAAPAAPAAPAGSAATCCECGTLLDDEAGEVMAPSVGCDAGGCSRWACLACAGFRSEAEAGRKTWFCTLHAPVTLSDAGDCGFLSQLFERIILA